MSKRHTDDRGFTLLELLMTLALASVFAAALYGTFGAMNRSFYTQSQAGELQTSGRLALDTLITNLRNAAFGVPPDVALNVAPGGANCLGSNCPQSTAGTAWKSTCMTADNVPSLYGTDELVFIARDPVSLYKSSFAGGAVQFDASTPATYETAGSYMLALAPNFGATVFYTTAQCLTGCGAVNLAPNVFCPYAPAALSVQPTETTLVRYVHFYVDWTDPNHPVLMEGDGLSDPQNNNMEFTRPVASNVEDLQFAYHVTDPANNFLGWLTATDLTTRINNLGGAKAVLSTIDFIRASVIVRSELPDSTIAAAPANNPSGCLCVENSPCCTGTPMTPASTMGPMFQYTRKLFQAVVPTANFGSWNPYFSNSIL